MKAVNMGKLSLDGERQVPRLPYEILVETFSNHRLPPASKIARDRYEGLNVQKGSLVCDSPINDYKHNDLHTKAEDHDGISYRFDAIHHKIVDFLRSGHEKCPQQKTIYLDKAMKFGRSVRPFGWRVERAVGAELLVRTGVVMETLVPWKEKEGWEKMQVERAGKTTVVLRRIS